MTYSELQQAQANAAQALYAAQDAALSLKATWRETGTDADFDAYYEARLVVDEARAAYDAVQSARVSSYVGTIRKA